MTVDGRGPATPAQLLALLHELGIATTTVEHPPVLTMAESRRVRGDLDGTPCKNLLLRDRTGVHHLVVLAEDRKLDLKALAAALGCSRLSFAPAECLPGVLGVGPGATTPFAVVNRSAADVRVVLERSLLAEDRLCFHPLSNAMTTAIAPADLLRFLREVHREPRVVDLP